MFFSKSETIVCQASAAVLKMPVSFAGQYCTRTILTSGTYAIVDYIIGCVFIHDHACRLYSNCKTALYCQDIRVVPELSYSLA